MRQQGIKTSIHKLVLAAAINMVVLLNGYADSVDAEHLQRAKQYWAQGDTRASVIELKNALQANGENAGARLLLGQIYLTTTNAISAEKEIRRAISYGAAAGPASTLLSKALIRQGKFQEALTLLSSPEVFREGPLGERWALRGRALLGLGKRDDAAAAFDKALTEKADLPDGFFGKARLALIDNQMAAARTLLDKVLSIDPEYASAWSLRAFLDSSEGNFEAAEEAFSRAMQNPINRDVSQLGRASLRIGMKKLDAAEEDIKSLRARKSLTGYAGLNYLDGLLHFKRQQFPKASGLFQTALSTAPNHTAALFYAGATNLILGHKAMAIDYLDRHLTRRPNNTAAKNLLAEAHLKNDNPSDAKAYALAVLQQSPDDIVAMNLLADALNQQGDRDAATELLKEVVLSHPESAIARLRLGNLMANQGLTDEALQELELALELDPTLPQAAASLVIRQLQAGDLDKALTSAVKHRERQPNAAPAYVLLGVTYLARDELEDASSTFRQALAIDPGNAQAYAGLAAIALKRENWEQAEVHYREAVAHHPDAFAIYLNLAKVETLQEDTKGAESALIQAIALRPRDLLPRLMLASHLLQEGKPEHAIREIREIRADHPNSSEMLKMLARAQLTAKHYDDAKPTLLKLVQLTPEDTWAHFSLAMAYDGLGDAGNMHQALIRTNTLDPHFGPAQLALARWALQENRLDEVESRLKALKPLVGKDNPELLLIEARLAERKGDLPSAISIFRDLFAEHNSVEDLNRLTQAQWRSGDHHGAVAQLEQWLRQYPTDVGVALQLAQRYLSLNRHSDAISRYQSVLKIDSGNALALNNLAALLLESDPKAALEYAKRVYALVPGDPVAMDTLADALLHNGEQKLAERLIERALEQQPDNLTFQYRRAQLLEAQGQKSAAIQALTQMLRAGRSFSEQEGAQTMLARLQAGA